jgi:hypothetical protein
MDKLQVVLAIDRMFYLPAGWFATLAIATHFE